jgi:hypothetical protein
VGESHGVGREDEAGGGDCGVETASVMRTRERRTGESACPTLDVDAIGAREPGAAVEERDAEAWASPMAWAGKMRRDAIVGMLIQHQ